MKRIILCCTVVFVLAIAVTACQSAQPAVTTPQPTPVASQSAITTEDQVSLGKSSFQGSCTCHAEGFSSSVLANYGTARNLLDKVSKTMPKSSPGSLSRQQYFDVVAYLLSQAKLLQPDQIVDDASAPTIQLK